MSHQTPEMILAIDFSLDRLDIALQAPNGTWLITHQSYENNQPGCAAMIRDVLLYLTSFANAQLTAVGESTGLYWWHAFYQIATDRDLSPYTPRLALLNPAHVKRFRKALPESDKTDEQDPRLIARYYTTVGVKHFHDFNARYLPLRVLTRAYHRLIHTLAAQKAYAVTLIYLLASEYQRLKPFSDVFGVTSQFVLSDYADIARIAAIPVDTLATELNLHARGSLPAPHKNARTLHRVAANSYPLPAFLQPPLNRVLTTTLEHIRFMERQKKHYTATIAAELERFPQANEALALKGLGPILVAGCLSEIQDTSRFTTGRKYDRKQKRWRDRTYRDGQAGVANLAGLWWPENTSGRFQGQDRHLARERNAYLRYWFIQAAYSLKGQRAEYADYYWKKFHEVTKHRHKRALVLTARKAVRLIFALLHKGQAALQEEATAA